MVDDLFTLDPSGEYHYDNGYNFAAVGALVVAFIAALMSVMIPKLGHTIEWLSNYSWFIGMGCGFLVYLPFAKAKNVAGFGER